MVGFVFGREDEYVDEVTLTIELEGQRGYKAPSNG